MNTLSLVIQREYLTRVRKKSFIIMTLLMPLLMASLSFVPLWLSTLNDGGEKNIVVIDETGMYAPLLKSTEQYQFQIVEQAQQSEYQAKIGKDLFAILHITDDLNVNPNAISLLSEKESPQDLRAIIEKTLSEKVMQQKLDELSQSGNVSAESILQVRSIVESGSKVSIKIMKWDETAPFPNLQPKLPQSLEWFLQSSFTCLFLCTETWLCKQFWKRKRAASWK